MFIERLLVLADMQASERMEHPSVILITPSMPQTVAYGAFHADSKSSCNVSYSDIKLLAAAESARLKWETLRA